MACRVGQPIEINTFKRTTKNSGFTDRSLQSKEQLFSNFMETTKRRLIPLGIPQFLYEFLPRVELRLLDDPSTLPRVLMLKI